MNTLKKILLAAIENLENGEFENDSFYSSLPKNLLDTIEESNNYRSIDEYIAIHAIKYPELHDLMREFVDYITDYNNQTPLWDNEEHVGGAIARELALYHKSDVILFARFITSNDLNHEVFQAEDMENVVEKWGACRETYSVIVARWLTPGQHRYEFDYDSVIDSIKSKEDANVFMDAVAQWFNERWFLPYNIQNCYDSVVELLMMIFEQLNYTESEIEDIIDFYIKDIPAGNEEIDEKGRSVTIQDKKTLEYITITYDIDNTKISVNYALTENIAMEYSGETELNQAVSELELRCKELGYAWVVTKLPALVDSFIEGNGTEIDQPIDILSLFTPEGEETAIEKMNADILKDQKKIVCRKLQLYKSITAVTMIFCDMTGKRILDSGAFESECLWSYETETEMLAALENIKKSYLEKGYELVLDETLECAFDYIHEQTKQTAEFMKQQKEWMAEYELNNVAP